MTKRDVESLLAEYDLDPEAALCAALRRVLDRSEGTFAELWAAADLDPASIDDIVVRDALVRRLNELRDLTS